MNTNASIFKIHKIQHLSQFVKNDFEISCLDEQNHFITKSNDWWNRFAYKERSSCMTLVGLRWNVITHPTTQCESLVFFKGGYLYSFVPPEHSVLNNAKPFRDMDYGHIRLFVAANWTLRFLIAFRKNDKTEWPVRTFG